MCESIVAKENITHTRDIQIFAAVFSISGLKQRELSVSGMCCKFSTWCLRY